VKDHLIPHIDEKMISKEMHDALVGLYHNGNIKQEVTFEAPTSIFQDV
jgi:hypothetical protein